MPLANRLNAIYKLKYPLQHDVNENLGTTEEHSLDLAHLKLQNVVDVEPINTRGGLLVFLDALVSIQLAQLLPKAHNISFMVDRVIRITCFSTIYRRATRYLTSGPFKTPLTSSG